MLASLSLSLTLLAAPVSAHRGTSPRAKVKVTPGPKTPAPKPFAWPTPDLIEDAEVPGGMTSNGIPIRLRAVKLRRKIPELARLYAQAYEQAGFYIPPGKHQVDLFRNPSLTALDPRRFISYTAIFQANPDGTTTVILGEANLALAKSQDVPPGFPVFEGARHLTHFQLEGAEVVSYSASGTPQAVAEFYGKALAKQGFTKAADAAGGNVFRKGDTELELDVASKRDETAVVVMLRHPQAAPAVAEKP